VCVMVLILGQEGCRSHIQQSSSETDWYTLPNSRLYMPASWYIGGTYDWVGTSNICSIFFWFLKWFNWLHYTLCFKKRPLLYFSNNTDKNQWNDFCVQNPEDILHILFISSYPPPLKNVSKVLYEMQISCSWSKWHCFP